MWKRVSSCQVPAKNVARVHESQCGTSWKSNANASRDAMRLFHSCSTSRMYLYVCWFPVPYLYIVIRGIFISNMSSAVWIDMPLRPRREAHNMLNIMTRSGNFLPGNFACTASLWYQMPLPHRFAKTHPWPLYIGCSMTKCCWLQAGNKK